MRTMTIRNPVHDADERIVNAECLQNTMVERNAQRKHDVDADTTAVV